jgi:hypothetical protein
VPTNTLAWCHLSSTAEPLDVGITDASGAVVSGTQTELGAVGYQVVVFHPSAELAPNTPYRVTCRRAGRNGSVYDFTTGDGARQEQPAISSLVEAKVFASDDELDPSVGASFDVVSDLGGLLVFDIGGAERLDGAAASGRVAAVSAVNEGPNEVTLSSGYCGGNWPAAKLGETITVRAGAFAWTGGFSGWTESVTVTLPEHYEREESSGCQLRPPLSKGGSLATAGLVALFAFARARRRRSSSPVDEL